MRALAGKDWLSEYLRNHQYLNIHACVIADLQWYQHHSNPVIWKSITGIRTKVRLWWFECGKPSVNPCDSKYDLQASSVLITWKLVSNEEPQALPQTYQILNQSLRFSKIPKCRECTLKGEKLCYKL